MHDLAPRIWPPPGSHARRAGMTLIELTVALGMLAIAMGGFIEMLVNVNIGQEELWNRQQAFQSARNVAEDVIQEQGDWNQLCADYDAMPGADVVVQDGDGSPTSGWAKITVRVRVPADGGSFAREARLVFGRKK